jgi:L-rhamnonate dehydratase
MRIVAVEAWQPIAENSPPDWRTTFGQIAVRIRTGDGLVGYGVGGGGRAGVMVVESVLAPLLQGCDPSSVETLWDRMYRATLPFGRKGIAVMALSGVDLALWDLRAKAAGTSVAKLLNHHSGGRAPVYRTIWSDVDPEAVAGRHGIKLHIHPREPLRLQNRGEFVETVVERVAAARAAIGPARSLMVDGWMTWDAPSTLMIARRIAALNVAWIEEPLAPDDIDGYCRLRDECELPIAGGEHEFTPYGFEQLVNERLHRILQPDVCWCGGLTALRRIYEMAGAAQLRIVPHRGAEVWGLHAIAALDPDPLAEEGRPWMTWVHGQPVPDETGIVVPDGLGFGVQLDGGPQGPLSDYAYS